MEEKTNETETVTSGEGETEKPDLSIQEYSPKNVKSIGSKPGKFDFGQKGGPTAKDFAQRSKAHSLGARRRSAK